MKIYIDFDDCLCETARHFSGLVKDLFGKNVPYEKIRCFDLQSSFSLTEEQFRELMVCGHTPEALLSYRETPGAIRTVHEWMDQGHDVSVITGRPFSAYEPSREWLDQRGLEHAGLYCLNKYGRDSFAGISDYNLKLGEYYQMHFDYAVEDSPLTFPFFRHLPELKVMIYDRPWNQGCEFPGDNYRRCFDWEMIRSLVKDKAKGELIR